MNDCSHGVHKCLQFVQKENIVCSPLTFIV